MITFGQGTGMLRASVAVVLTRGDGTPPITVALVQAPHSDSTLPTFIAVAHSAISTYMETSFPIGLNSCDGSGRPKLRDLKARSQS